MKYLVKRWPSIIQITIALVQTTPTVMPLCRHWHLTQLAAKFSAVRDYALSSWGPAFVSRPIPRYPWRFHVTSTTCCYLRVIPPTWMSLVSRASLKKIMRQSSDNAREALHTLDFSITVVISAWWRPDHLFSTDIRIDGVSSVCLFILTPLHWLMRVRVQFRKPVVLECLVPTRQWPWRPPKWRNPHSITYISHEFMDCLQAVAVC